MYPGRHIHLWFNISWTLSIHFHSMWNIKECVEGRDSWHCLIGFMPRPGATLLCLHPKQKNLIIFLCVCLSGEKTWACTMCHVFYSFEQEKNINSYSAFHIEYMILYWVKKKDSLDSDLRSGQLVKLIKCVKHYDNSMILLWFQETALPKVWTNTVHFPSKPLGTVSPVHTKYLIGQINLCWCNLPNG